MVFSIIIPVYNAQETLPHCLDSIINQTFQDYEVLLINDGSEDQSAKVCADAANDKRFRVFYQNNKGPGAARNKGLLNARGDYVCFIDSDDYICPDYLEQLYLQIKATCAEAIFFGYNKVNTAGDIVKVCVPEEATDSYNTKELLLKLSEQDLFGYTWIKCFSKTIIDKNCFFEDMRLFEDEVFSCQVLKKECKISVLKNPIYCYVADGNQMLTASTHPDYCILTERVYCAWKELLQGDDNTISALLNKADYFVRRCQFYGFEHEVDIKTFFMPLSQTTFFKEHSNWNKFDRLIEKNKWNAIWRMQKVYQLKQAIGKALYKNRIG